MAQEQKPAGEIVLDAIPLVVAEETKTPAQVRRGFRVPKIVDYLVVAIFMYFTL